MIGMDIMEYVDRMNGEFERGDISAYGGMEPIGAGGFSSVYRVVRGGRAYAMKVPRGVSPGETTPWRGLTLRRWTRSGRWPRGGPPCRILMCRVLTGASPYDAATPVELSI